MASAQTALWRSFFPVLLLAVATSACAAGRSSDYEVAFHATLLPQQGAAEATITITQDDRQLRVLDLNAPVERYAAAAQEGLARDGARLRWSVPANGGVLRYRVRVNNTRGDAYDAHMTDSWAVFRFEDLFPPARSVSRRGAGIASATVALSGPPGWSFESGYGAVEEPRAFSNPERRFDQPLGWVAGGELGVRRDRVSERRVAVAGPVGQSLRRQDMLAFLRWTLPDLVSALPSLPERLLIVSAGDPLWRGALSAPNSLYLHADRPLISENGTSTLLHELVHVATAEAPPPGDDWIAEGLAEYLGLKLLRRSGGISERRFERALESLERWAERDGGALKDPSKGADTAFAALLFRKLDEELSAAGSSLEAVAAPLLGEGPPSRQRLLELATLELNGPSVVLDAHLSSQMP